MMLPKTLYLFRIRAPDPAKAEEHFCCLRHGCFVSILTGTYICTFSQKHLQSSANMTIDVIPLPRKQNILIDPIEAPIRCRVQQALECCISAGTMDNYTVTFMVQQNEFQVGKKQ